MIWWLKGYKNMCLWRYIRNTMLRDKIVHNLEGKVLDGGVISTCIRRVGCDLTCFWEWDKLIFVLCWASFSQWATGYSYMVIVTVASFTHFACQ